MATPAAPPRASLFGIAIVAGFAVVAALLFAAIYLALPEDGHFFSLLGIGILSLVFALGAYLAQAAAPDPGLPRALSWGFAGVGFVLLFGTLLLDAGPVLSFLEELVALIVVLAFLLAAVLGAYWRSRALAATQARLEIRDAWRSQPPRSALEYAAAQRDRDVTSGGPSAPKSQP